MALIALGLRDRAIADEVRALLHEAGQSTVNVQPEHNVPARIDLLLVDEETALSAGPLMADIERRDREAFLPVAVFLPEEADGTRWLEGGYDDVLQIPVRSAQLLTRVRALLALRRRFLEAERLSLIRNSALLDSAIDAVVTFDQHGLVLECNPAAESMFLYEREAVLGRELLELMVPAELRAPYRNTFKHYLETGRSVFIGRRTEVSLMRATGEVFTAEIHVTRVEAHGRFTFTAFMRDLTERKRSEAGLAQLAAIVESSEDAIVSNDLAGRITTWNAGAERLFGYTAAEALGKPVAMLYHPRRSPNNAPAHLVVERGARYADFDAVCLHKDGRAIEVGLSVSPIFGADRAIIGASTIAYDMAERNQERLALQRSEARYRSLVAAITSVVWTSDGEGRFLAPQPSWEAYTGQAWPEHAGWGWSVMLQVSERRRMTRTWRAALARGEIFQDECRVRHRGTGQYRHMLLRAVPIKDAAGAVEEWVGTLNDVEDAKRAEIALHALNFELEQRVAQRTADLEQANNELEAFSYSVSHDLRAPLRAIAGFTQIILDSHGEELNEEAKRLMHRVTANVGRMDALVSDLLHFSRMSRTPISKRELNPEQLMREVAEELLADIGERGIDLRIDELPDCVADPSLLRQVFVNLLSNALKYTEGRSPALIHVGCDKPNDPLAPPVYYVRDNGIGFDMRFAAKLFQVFERLHPEQHIEGTGVGLALVRRIVERHGGQVWAEAEPDRGATFFFTLEAPRVLGARSLRAVR